MEHLLNNYNPNKHPHVLARKKTCEDVKGFFMNSMERKAVDEQVSREAFVDYYA